MKKRISLLGALVVLSTLWSASAQSPGDFKIIVNPQNSVASVSKGDVSNLFLKKKGRWDNGVEVLPVDLDAKSDVRQAFSKVVHGRSTSSIKNYWQRQIFSGREVPPPELESDAAVLEFVRANPGAIGYVSPGTSLSGVREVPLAE